MVIVMSDRSGDGAGQKWICTRCGKVVSREPFGRCHDCDGGFRPATADDLACDRCGDPDGVGVLGSTDRFCEDCLDEVDAHVA